MYETVKGFKVYAKTENDLLNQLMKDIENDDKKIIMAINPEKLMIAEKDPQITGILHKADYLIPDGQGIIWLSKKQKGSIRERITGCDLFQNICAKVVTENKSVFLYGAKPGVAAKAAEKLIETNPGLKIAGVIDGYEKDEDKIIDEINKSGADAVFVALGSPKQELWMIKNQDRINAKILQGVGGSFDVVSGNIPRAPKWMQKIGLEWFYRVLKDLKRVNRMSKLIKYVFLGR